GRARRRRAIHHPIPPVSRNARIPRGGGKTLESAKPFASPAPPALDLPADAQSPSGLYHRHKLFWPSDPATQVDPGRLAFGQESMIASPVQMAMVASTVANGGVLMQPHLIDSLVAPDGNGVRKTKPQ